MILFSVLLMYILFLSRVIYQKNLINCWRSSRDRLYIILTMGLLLLLNCLRGLDVGNDTLSYKGLFDYYINGQLQEMISDEGIQWMNGLDIGFRRLTYFFGKISANYQLYISFIALLIYLVVSGFLYRESDNIGISVVLFYLTFFHPYLNVLRQSIAISIILIGFGNIKKKRYIRFAIYVIAAALFHRTAIVALILIPLMKVKKLSIRGMLGILFVIVLLTLTGFFNKFLSMIGYSGKYASEEQGLSTYAHILLSSIIFILLLYWRGKSFRITSIEEIINEGTDMEAFYSRMTLLDLCLSVAAINIPILYRCSYYFTIFHITGIPYFVMRSQRDSKMIRYSFNILLSAYIVFQLGILIWRPEWVSEFNYKFFWQ